MMDPGSYKARIGIGLNSENEGYGMVVFREAATVIAAPDLFGNLRKIKKKG